MYESLDGVYQNSSFTKKGHEELSYTWLKNDNTRLLIAVFTVVLILVFQLLDVESSSTGYEV